MTEPTSSNYPSALDNDTSLGGDQVNIKSFTLGSGIGTGETSIPASAAISGVTAPFYLLADSELIYVEGVSGSDFTPSVRGAGGTTAASHSAGITLYVVYAANLFNQLKRAIVAIETELGITPSVFQYVPDGTMLNGRIVPTVVSNDLVLTLVAANTGLAPTSTNPIIIKINGTMRRVTAATSITIPDGTNFFNSGSDELGTRLVPYFVYLVWDSSSSVAALSIARVPWGRLVSNFNSTNTNERHLYNYANFTSTDDVVNIGYFEATLSLTGTGHLWTVPTFTNANLINEPTYKSRRMTWLPIHSGNLATSGYSVAPTNALYEYAIDNLLMYVTIRETTNGTSNGTNLTMSLPMSAVTVTNGAWQGVASGIDNGAALTTPVRMELGSGGGTLFCYPNMAASSTWTAGATGKRIGQGSIIYPIG